ncbi:malate dehydrogenase [Roseovarius sp. S1116L3]|uniref:malate dehydrogenase n=1 Tax=Roseovarius roseus TaxID=3342636 RepID=UPI00372868C0
MMTLPKVAVIGAGLVGGSAALLIQAVIPGCEVVIVDIDRQRAEGQAMDIAHAGALWRAVHVRAGDYGDVAGSSVIVITAGVAMKSGQSRLDLAKANLEVLTDILDAVAEGSPDATYVIATNPVDVLGHIAQRRLGLAAGRVISTGTALDSARLRSLLAERLEIAPGAIHAYVLGEHGDSSMIDWSGATIGGRPISYRPARMSGSTPSRMSAVPARHHQRHDLFRAQHVGRGPCQAGGQRQGREGGAGYGHRPG